MSSTVPPTCDLHAHDSISPGFFVLCSDSIHNVLTVWMYFLQCTECRAKMLIGGIIGQTTAGKITRCDSILLLFQEMVADRDTVAVR